MPHVQNGRYNLSISIDNMDLLSTGCQLGKCSLYESIFTHIPTCEMSITVPSKLMDQRSIVDGSKIRIEIEFCFETGKPKEAYTYRIYKINKLELKEQYITLDIEGVIDFYEGYTEANKYNKFASTGEIFKQIAETNGLASSISLTNDEQLWIAGQKNVFHFLQFLSERGWINETSCMFWALDRHKILIYRDLSSLIAQRSDDLYTFKQTPFSETEKLTYGYSTCSSSIASGEENVYGYGYGGKDHYFDLLSYEQKEVTAKKAIAWSNLFNINKELSKGLSDTFFQFDVGNHHPNYNLAKIQNKRLLSTYSSYTTLESQFFQPYRLGQIVNLEYTDVRNPQYKIDCLSGIRIIDAIRIDITMAYIRSSVELAMQGLNGRSLVQEVY